MKSDAVLALESAAWPVMLVDGAGTLCHVNGAARQVFGLASSGVAVGLASIWSSENAAGPEQWLGQQEPSKVAAVSLRFQVPVGKTVSYLTLICPYGEEGRKHFVMQCLPESVLPPARVAVNEVAQAQIHSQKLDCALQLARTVALDFNNALTSILGHASLILSRMEVSHPWRHSLIEIEKSAARAAEIASDLAAFSRQEKEARTQTAGNLNQQVQRCVEYFQRNPGPEPAQWTLRLERQLYAAKFDEAKMQQAFVRIIENAVQALRGGAGRITVQTRNHELTEPTQDRNVQLAAGAYVCVEITDNGAGIEADVLPRVFEPFFTTKRSPHRGLGLAWVYGIVTNHGGGVAISSGSGTGTSVRVYLPAEKRMVREQTIAAGDLNGSGQTILMVDDEDLLLTMGQTILTSYGYRVLTANSGQKALELLGRKEPVDLLITDLVMPAMSGRELVEQVQKLAPGTKILCTSGYVWPPGQDNSGAYLQKPFTTQELLVKVKEVLAS